MADIASCQKKLSSRIPYLLPLGGEGFSPWKWKNQAIIDIFSEVHPGNGMSQILYCQEKAVSLQRILKKG